MNDDLIAFYCFAPSTCVSLSYAENVFSELKNRLPSNISFIVKIADFDLDLDKMADEILEELKNKKCKKLVIGGWCNGGVQAIQLLEKINDPSIHIYPAILFDTFEPNFLLENGEPEEVPVKESLTLFYQQMYPNDDYDIYESFKGVPIADMKDCLLKRIADINGNLRRVQRMLDKYEQVRNELVSNKGHIKVDTYQYNKESVLFYTMFDKEPDADPYLGWSNYFVPEIIKVPANHFTMFHGESLNIIENKLKQILSE